MSFPNPVPSTQYCSVNFEESVPKGTVVSHLVTFSHSLGINAIKMHDLLSNFQTLHFMFNGLSSPWIIAAGSTYEVGVPWTGYH